MLEKQTHIFHSISWFCNFTPEEKNHRVIRQNGRFSIFFSFVFFFFFFFPMHTGYPSAKISWHEVRFSPVYIAARCNGTLGSRIAFVICTDEILRDSRNTKPFAPVSQKKKKKKTAIHQPWKRREPDKIKDKQRNSKSLNPIAFTLTVN